MNENIELIMMLPKIPDIELVALEGMDRMARYMGITEEKISKGLYVHDLNIYP